MRQSEVETGGGGPAGGRRWSYLIHESFHERRARDVRPSRVAALVSSKAVRKEVVSVRTRIPLKLNLKVDGRFTPPRGSV